MRNCNRILGICALVASLLLAACQGSGEGEGEGYRQGTHLLYYPEANTYLDQDNKVYLVLDTVEQKWITRKELGNEEQAALGSAVVLEKPSVPVYKDNAQHRLMYGTARYTDPAEIARKRREDSLASAPPAAPPDTVTATPVEAPKKKTKVGRWLQKIFGKKKDE